MRKPKFFVALMLTLALAGCGDSAEKAQLRGQIETLAKERDDLAAEVKALKETPDQLMQQFERALPDTSAANLVLSKLKEKHPKAEQTAQAEKLLADARAELERKAEEAKRLKAQGFKSLPVAGKIASTDATHVFGAVSFVNQVRFDQYDSSYHYVDADRGTKFAALPMTTTAAKGELSPTLPQLSIYRADGDKLRKIEAFEVRFRRWEDYGSYLGNYSDTANDFAKVPTVGFVLLAQVSEDYMRQRPLYVVGQLRGCLERTTDRFRNPPIRYQEFRGGCEMLKSELSVEDFAAPGLVVVRRID